MSATQCPAAVVRQEKVQRLVSAIDARDRHLPERVRRCVGSMEALGQNNALAHDVLVAMDAESMVRLGATQLPDELLVLGDRTF